MKAVHLLLVFWMFALARGFAAEEKWVVLFNGLNLSGWVDMNGGKFSVTNDFLHLEKGTGWLRTESQYADFVLEAQWRALETNYNSGFFIRSGTEGKPFPDTGLQINLKENCLGCLLKGRDTILSAKTPKSPVGEWVTFLSEARGKKLSLDVDGVRIWEFAGVDSDRGYIGIQAEGKSFDFRNIRIHEFSQTEPLKQN